MYSKETSYFSCVEHVCYIQSQCSVVYIAYIAALICLGYLIATYVSFRTRFYGFNIPCPFGYKTSKAVPVQDGEGHVHLTSADADRYKTKDSDHLPAGTYTCVGNQTFFYTYKTTATSRAPNTFGWMIEDVENECIIPNDVLKMIPSPMATFTMVLTLTRSEYEVLTLTRSEYDAAGKGTPIKEEMIWPNVVELQHSKSLAASVCKMFGEDYTVKCNEQLLSKSLPFCMYATSKPDLVVFHQKKLLL